MTDGHSDGRQTDFLKKTAGITNKIIWSVRNLAVPNTHKNSFCTGPLYTGGWANTEDLNEMLQSTAFC